MGEERILATRPPSRRLGPGALAAAAVAVASTASAYVEYAGAARAPWIALAMAGTFFGVAFAVLLGFRSTFAFTRVQGPRPAPAPGPDGASPCATGGRRGLAVALGGSIASLAAGALLPLRSLGRTPGDALRATAWRRGVRLVTPEGVGLRPADLAPGSATPVVPDADPAQRNSIAVLVRLRGGGQGDQVRAYSGICTHAGCAVCAFRAAESTLICPCHRSIFDAADGGRVVEGPASLPLPELPLGVDTDGYLVAQGDFSRHVGPHEG
jgi:ubiquinol-cytochrome c reductase iron-sulfur subunit